MAKKSVVSGLPDLTITERKEPFTLNEVFEFIDDTAISKLDSHELKSRIVDVLQAERNKAINDYKHELLKHQSGNVDTFVWCSDICRIAAQLKAGGENETD